MLAGVVIAACGGSSNSSSTSAGVAAKAATAGGTSSRPSAQVQREITKARQRLEKRDVGVRECLQKGGISTATKLGIQVSSQPPKGMTHAQYEAFVNKCGAHVENPVLRQAGAKFAACMRENGVNYPAPGTSAALGAKGLNTTSSAYKKALAKCRSVLSNALRATARAGGTGAAGSVGQAKAPPAALTVKVPASVTAILTRFTTCMRTHGVGAFPQPKGATFDMTGTHIDTHSATYKSAETHCNLILRALDQTG
jgi:hypothetical protein